MLNKIEYDKEANAIYIRFVDKPCAYTKQIDNLRYVDYAYDGTPIGVELLNVSNGVVVDVLPHSAEVTQMLEGKHIKVYA